MAKPRRNIKFNHRNGHSSSADGRRSSFSDISEVASEPGSPLKAGGDGTLEVSFLQQMEECMLIYME
jgi:phosphatidate cytidylyltransferase